MSRWLIKYLIWMGILLFAAAPLSSSSVEAAVPPVPGGFTLVASAPGVELYRKDYTDGTPDFVQVVDLSQGARLVSLHGEIADPGSGQGVYGGSDARFRSRSLESYWRELSSTDQNAFCVSNGQFFYMKEYPTRLPFPLKVDGAVITDGYGLGQFKGQKLMLELWPGRADIRPLTQEALYSSNAPDIIVGLTEDAPKQAKRYTGRTFVGIQDRDGDGQSETLLVFNTFSARQVDAAEALRSFGAAQVMMLDGGGSTQLICEGKSYISSERLIPQAIGILAGGAGVSVAPTTAGGQDASLSQPGAPAPVESAPREASTQADIQPAQEATPASPAPDAPTQAVTQPAQEATPASPPQNRPDPALQTAAADSQVAADSQMAADSQVAAEGQITAEIQGDATTQGAVPGAVPVAEPPASQDAAAIPPAAGAQVPLPGMQGQAGTGGGEAASPSNSTNLGGQTLQKSPPEAPGAALGQAALAEAAQNAPGQADVSLAQPESLASAQAVQPGGLQSTALPVQSQLRPQDLPIRMQDAIWVPASMSPLILLLFLIVSRIRSQGG